jgi:hypothetical protein
MPRVGIFVLPPPHPAPYLVSLHDDLYMRGHDGERLDRSLGARRPAEHAAEAPGSSTMGKASSLVTLAGHLAFSATCVHLHGSTQESLGSYRACRQVRAKRRDA